LSHIEPALFFRANYFSQRSHKGITLSFVYRNILSIPPHI